LAQNRVYLAEPYQYGEMGSLGKASGMLIRQFHFPFEYTDNMDQLLHADHDRLYQQDYKRASECIKKHTGTGELGLGSWAMGATDDEILAFLKEILEADQDVNWTGFRILGTVHRSNGGPVWSLQLFAKSPDTDTEVFSGQNAPNVLSGPRN